MLLEKSYKKTRPKDWIEQLVSSFTDTGREGILLSHKEELSKLHFDAIWREKKYGELKIDSIPSYEIYDRIKSSSTTTCELCGATGKTRTDLGRVYTLCDLHYNKYKEKHERRKSHRKGGTKTPRTDKRSKDPRR